jgi:hypothetical protein
MKKERHNDMTKRKRNTFEYVSAKKYDGAMGRCYRETDNSYKNYGARGIRVCTEWINSLNSFRDWARRKLAYLGISEEEFIKNPKEYQLDRIDSNGHYTPLNCTFSSSLVNQRNKTNRTKRIIISAEGEEILV